MSIPTMVDEDEKIKRIFWSCPIRFIPDSVWSFTSIYLFYQNHPQSLFPKYDNVSPRYLMAETILHSELTKGREEK